MQAIPFTKSQANTLCLVLSLTQDNANTDNSLLFDLLVESNKMFIHFDVADTFEETAAVLDEEGISFVFSDGKMLIEL